MGTYTGTDGLDTISVMFGLSPGVIADPPGTTSGDGPDILIGNDGFDYLEAGAGDDILDGGDTSDHLLGGDGNDLLDGGTGDDEMEGNAGDDRLIGGLGNDRLVGGAGDDTLEGGAGSDVYLVTGLGDRTVEDTADASGGGDAVRAYISWTLGFGIETLYLQGRGSAAIKGTGNALDNTFFGSRLDNILSGMRGNDRLYGNQGDDRLRGGFGDDRLHGASGEDWFKGGPGDDEFWLSDRQDTDTIADFHNMQGNNDRIVIETLYFKGGLERGRHLSPEEFQASDGHEAQDSEVRFIFDTRHTELWFDGNGDAAGRLALVVNLQASAHLQANDIWLV